MDYPVINGYNQTNAKINGKAGLAISLFFPIGFPVYLLATYQRKTFTARYQDGTKDKL